MRRGYHTRYPRRFGAHDMSFDSRPMPPGRNFTRSLPAAGAFPYHCSVQPWMQATVTVTE
jgi:hypothetical protein